MTSLGRELHLSVLEYKQTLGWQGRQTENCYWNKE